MDNVKKDFSQKYEKYFPGSEFPLACYFSDNLNDAEFPDAPKANKRGLTCIFSQLAPVRAGKSRAFNLDNLGCWGAKGLLGFMPAEADEHTVDFIVNVEKYKKSDEHVKAMFEKNHHLKAPGKYLIFKRWDLLTEKDEPQVVIFFCTPDVLAALHSLANFDTMNPYGVIAPFGSGCETLVSFPMSELKSETPKAVVGLMDTSARACVKPGLLSFSIPWPKFLTMLENMDDSFLNTFIWEKIKNRMINSL